MAIFRPRRVKQRMHRAIHINGMPVLWNDAGSRTAVRVVKPRERAIFNHYLARRSAMFAKAKDHYDRMWQAFGWS